MTTPNGQTTSIVESPDTIFRKMVLSYKDQFRKALPKHLTADRFIRIVLTALTKTPKLTQCSDTSFMTCLLDLSQLGLEPDGRKAHLIPYGGECKLVIDYKGYVDLAYRSSMVTGIHADVVGANDVFEYQHGTESFLRHIPALGERGEIVAVYAIAKLKDGGSVFEVMGVKEVEGIRDRSEGWKAYKSGKIKSSTWGTDENEMRKKTAFRRLSKWIPMTPEFMEAQDKDFDSPDFTPAAAPDPASLMPRELPAPAADAPPAAPRISETQAADFRAYVTGNGYTEAEAVAKIGKPIAELTPDEHHAAIAQFPEKPKARR